MAEHPNAQIYRDAMAAFMGGEMDKTNELVAEDVVWWQIGSDEPVRGRDAVLESMSGLAGLDFEVELHDVTASDDHVVGLVTATVRTGDQEFTYRTAEIGHVKDGKLTERWAFSDDTAAIIDFFSQLG